MKIHAAMAEKRILSAFFALFLAVIVFEAAHASTILVSHSGTDTETCGTSAQSPCKTVVYASTRLSNGGVLAIEDSFVPYDCGAKFQGIDVRVATFQAFQNVTSSSGYSVPSPTLSATAAPTTNGGTRMSAAPIYGVVFDCMGAERAFVVTGGNVVISSVVVRNGRAPVGGAIAVWRGNLTLSNCTFDANVATATGPVAGAAGFGGGALYAEASAVAIISSTFTNNTALNGGGALVVLDATAAACKQPHIFGSSFSGNSAVDSGGAVAVTGLVDFFSLDSAAAAASASIADCQARTLVVLTSFYNNTAAGGFGGAASFDFAGPSPVQLRITNSSFSSNAAGDDGGGGAVCAKFAGSGPSTTASDSEPLVYVAWNSFALNSIVPSDPGDIALGSGGAVYIAYGQAVRGGVSDVFSENVFSGNFAFMSGGALAIDHLGSVTAMSHVIRHNSFHGNAASSASFGSIFGGAVSFGYLNSASGVQHVADYNTFSGNWVYGYAPFGGAIGVFYARTAGGSTADCTHALSSNTFDGNSAVSTAKDVDGGAVSVTVVQVSRNVTVSLSLNTLSTNHVNCTPVDAECSASGGAVSLQAADCSMCGIVTTGDSFLGNWVQGSPVDDGESFGAAMSIDLDAGTGISLSVAGSSFSQNAALNASDAHGGAIGIRCRGFCEGSSATLINATFAGNAVYGIVDAAGGALFSDHVIGSMGSTHRIERCTFKNNNAVTTATGGATGGAVYISHAGGTNSNVMVYTTSFVGNYVLSVADGGGGALAWVSGDLWGPRNSALDVEGSTFTDNYVGYLPSALARLRVRGATRTAGKGGALLISYARAESCTHTVIGNTFSGNHVTDHLVAQGGAISFWKNGDAGLMTSQIISNVMSHNSLFGCDVCLGGAVSSYTGKNATNSLTNVTDNTFAGNTLTSMNPVNPLDQRSRHRCAGGAISLLNDGSCQGGRISMLRNGFSENGIYCGAFSYGGAVSILHANGTQNNKISFTSNGFSSNFAATNQSAYGGALSIVFGSAGPAYSCGSNAIGFRANTFDHNSLNKLAVNATGYSYAALGGAVCVIGCPDAMDPSTVGRGTFVRWVYKTTTTSIGDSFTSNRASCVGCSGGGFHGSNGNTSFVGAFFSMNAGGSFGGAINTDGDSAGLSIANSVVSFNSAERGGRELYAGGGGDVGVRNTTFVADEPCQSFFEMAYGGRLSIDGSSALSCPAGSQLTASALDPYITADPLGVYVNLVTSSFYGCLACPRNYYGLRGGFSNGTSMHPSTCLECPVGADCPDGGSDVRSLAGFWCGAVMGADSDSLQCYACPDGYCCAGDTCAWNTPCVGNRTGVLCGACKDGYGETLGSLECEAEDSCSGGYWVVVIVSVVVSLVIIGLLIGLPLASTALWKSFWYFVQMLPLVLDTVALRFAGGHLWAIFTFEPNIGGYTVCPYAGMSGVARIAMGYTVPAVAMVVVALLWTVHFLLVRRGLREDFDSYIDFDSLVKFDQRVYRAMESSDNDGFASFPQPRVTYLNTKRSGRFARAMVGIALLSYTRISITTFNLVSCVSAEGSSRLFLAGVVTCGGHWWQAMAYFVIGAVLIPVPLALAYLRYWAHRPSARPTWSTRWAVLVFEAPFVPTRWWWEAVILYRRLALAAMRVFISDPYWRSLALALGCLAAFGLNVYAAPFKNGNAQRVENSFLLGLAIIALLACRDGAYASFGVPGGGRIGESASRSVADVEIALAIVPMVITLIVVFGRLFWACTWVREVNWPLARFRKKFGDGLGDEDDGGSPNPSGVPDDYDSDGSGNTTPFHRTGSFLDAPTISTYSAINSRNNNNSSNTNKMGTATTANPNSDGERVPLVKST